MAALSPQALGSLLEILYPNGGNEFQSQTLQSVVDTFNSVFKSIGEKFDAGCTLVCVVFGWSMCELRFGVNVCLYASVCIYCIYMQIQCVCDILHLYVYMCTYIVIYR